jgi:hypothetical protein
MTTTATAAAAAPGITVIVLLVLSVVMTPAMTARPAPVAQPIAEIVQFIALATPALVAAAQSMIPVTGQMITTVTAVAAVTGILEIA